MSIEYRPNIIKTEIEINISSKDRPSDKKNTPNLVKSYNTNSPKIDRKSVV